MTKPTASEPHTRRGASARRPPVAPLFPSRGSGESRGDLWAAPRGPLAFGRVVDFFEPAQDRFLVANPELQDRATTAVLASPARALLGLAILGQALLADAALGIDEMLQPFWREVLPKPERHEERKAELLRARLLLNPFREGPAPLRGKTERAALTRPGEAGDDQLLLLECLQLAVGVALRHVPKTPEPARDFLEQLPARPGPFVQEAEQRGLGAVEPSHVDIPFWKVRLGPCSTRECERNAARSAIP